MSKYLIIFSPPMLEHLVSCDIISQWFFFERSSDIFNKHNYKVKYYYDFLNEDDGNIYKNTQTNFKFSMDELREKYNNDCKYVLNEVLKDNIYDNSIIIGFEPVGFDKILNNEISNKLKEKHIKLILSIYDPHGFHIL